MKNDFSFKDMNGRKVDPTKLRKHERFRVIDKKSRDQLGIFTKKDWERKFL